MQPVFEIIADNQNITDKIKDRLLSIRITDEIKDQSDTLEISLDDREYKIELPKTGAELNISLGYEEIGISHIGLFIVDELSLSSPPATLIIRARAANFRESLKAQKTRSWDETTIGKILNEIASDNDLESKVSKEFKNIEIIHLDQTEESDLHLLTRLGKQYDAIAKPIENYLAFVTREDFKSATDKKIKDIQLKPENVEQWRATIAERGKYQSVSAFWHDLENAERVKIKIGDGKPEYILRHNYIDADQAGLAASAKLESINRGVATVNITMQGDPSISIKAKLVLNDFREGVNGDWEITRVNHDFSSSGYKSMISAERKPGK